MTETGSDGPEDVAEVPGEASTPGSAGSDAPSAAGSDVPPAAEPDYEGPRRRARRERAERRAARDRAVAIENARREAKRKVVGQSADAPKAVPRSTIRGLKILLWSALASVVAVALGLVLYFTPLMSARDVAVSGAVAVPAEQVLAAAAVAPGTPLLQVNTDAVAERVATIRRVATARVQREYPSTLRITVVERVPVVVKDYPDGPHLFDRDGVDFATEPPPPTLPYLDADNPGPTDPATKAALEVMLALPPDVVAQVGRIAAPSVASIALTLTDGRVVVWGTNDRTDEKALKLAALLTQPGHTYDVSSPDLPTVK
ncbi:cell division protein FtsQ [Mycolicibacterium farcinogenes]|uniref:Cell division protein FtsQ n=1 Tax=Mycolicibacterium senegalense TaxID=1796 RepID=A0A378SZU8_9MYCO|nr:FtsQ-type POTRA domain-containing protein [Mycolicibacterium senegalense]CDP89341.1 cell division protein FtsQ [Mycolicibacterium farcinogenes]MDR7290588.1 cell division protein FtsQ [Mycolicibacterium senegalense]QZA22164.1 FtsQ-type POTRA domain-containing protein [Mycolicibacterium senegalense]STZ54059.1 cell division protein ftsQ [Mycolicibacterium senegalense]